MKFCIVVCVLLVVACYEASAYNTTALVKGDCVFEDVEDMLGQCVELHCRRGKNGNVKRFAIRCPPATCKDTLQIRQIAEDLDKTYPECCPSVRCA